MRIKKLVSSANIMQSKLFDASLRSSTYMRNNKGPRTEPCGTPHTILWKLVLVQVVIFYELCSIC